jgi:hypothetical protein
MFVEAFHSMIKDIHLALEVKTSFGNSTPTTDSSTKPALRSLDFPLTVVNGLVRKERRGGTCTQKLQSKA